MATAASEQDDPTLPSWGPYIAAEGHPHGSGVGTSGGPACPSEPAAASGTEFMQRLNPPPLPLPPTAYSHTGDMQVIAAVPVYFCSANDRSAKKGRKGGGASPAAAAAAPTQSPRLPKRGRKSGQEPTSQAAAAVAGGELRFEWKDRDAGLRQVAFDELTMPPPVCSCTGTPQRCYKWGRGGWQSSCCTPTMSMYPLPFLPVKRHGRVGGRKMSGGAFGKLLSRAAADGHDLSTPLDLKDHWAKHGTNGWITIK